MKVNYVDKRCFKVNEELKNLAPALTESEFKGLEKSIIAYGCRDTLIVFNEKWEDILPTIVDGHNRYEICKKHNIPYVVKYMVFETLEAVKVWICENSLSRRNLNDFQRIEMVSKLTEIQNLIAEGKVAKLRKSESVSPTVGQTKKLKIDNLKTIAKKAKVSRTKVAQAKAIKKAVEKFELPENIIKKLKNGETSINAIYNQIPDVKEKKQRKASKAKKLENNYNGDNKRPKSLTIAKTDLMNENITEAEEITARKEVVALLEKLVENYEKYICLTDELTDIKKVIITIKEFNQDVENAA